MLLATRIVWTESKSGLTRVYQEVFWGTGSNHRRHGLRDKPQLIYNVSGKGINIGGLKPPNIVTVKGSTAQVVTSEILQSITVIGYDNAVGINILPFLVFPEKTLLSILFEGVYDGMMNDAGYLNTDIFKRSVKTHFTKYIQTGNSKPCTWWTQKPYISIPNPVGTSKVHHPVVLPSHTSYLLPPMDAGCLGPFEKVNQQEAYKCTKVWVDPWRDTGVQSLRCGSKFAEFQICY